MEHYEIVHALQILRPGAQWALMGTTLADLNWLDEEQVKPTEQELLTCLAANPVDPRTLTIFRIAAGE